MSLKPYSEIIFRALFWVSLSTLSKGFEAEFWDIWERSTFTPPICLETTSNDWKYEYTNVLYDLNKSSYVAFLD